MISSTARPLNDLEWGECNDAYRFLGRMRNRLLYLVIPFIFLAGITAPYLFSSAAGGQLWTRVIATVVLFGLAYSAAYLSWLYYSFVTAVWQLWRHQLIKEPQVPGHLRAVR